MWLRCTFDSFNGHLMLRVVVMVKRFGVASSLSLERLQRGMGTNDGIFRPYDLTSQWLYKLLWRRD